MKAIDDHSTLLLLDDLRNREGTRWHLGGFEEEVLRPGQDLALSFIASAG